MTIAETVIQAIGRSSVFTLYGGYALVGGGQIQFQQGHQLSERRNRNGRVTYALYQYADDSKVEFKYAENRGFTLKAL